MNLSPRSAYVRAAILEGFSEFVTASGADASALALQAGLSERALRSPDMAIAWTSVGGFMELAARELHKPAIGLEWLLSTPVPPLNFGAIPLIARFTGTIEEWCSHSRAYWHWNTNASYVSLLESEQAGRRTLRVDFSKLVPPSRHQVEHILGGICLLVQALTGGAPGLEKVRFRHMRPIDTTLHEAFFSCPVEFGSTHDEFVYRRELHEHPIILDDATFRRWFSYYVEARSRSTPDQQETTGAAVQVAIQSLIGTEFCAQPHIAALLSMSSKTLQRQLAREGTSFPALHDGIREQLARQLLTDSDVPVRSIAGILGYAWTPAFTTAAKRWTGMSARAFRNASREAESGASTAESDTRREDL